MADESHAYKNSKTETVKSSSKDDIQMTVMHFTANKAMSNALKLSPLVV